MQPDNLEPSHHSLVLSAIKSPLTFVPQASATPNEIHQRQALRLSAVWLPAYLDLDSLTAGLLTGRVWSAARDTSGACSAGLFGPIDDTRLRTTFLLSSNASSLIFIASTWQLYHTTSYRIVLLQFIHASLPHRLTTGHRVQYHPESNSRVHPSPECIGFHRATTVLSSWTPSSLTLSVSWPFSERVQCSPTLRSQRFRNGSSYRV
jgi:hypothetical protein